MTEKNSDAFVFGFGGVFLGKETTKSPKVIKLKRAGRKHANSFDGWFRRKQER